MMMQTATCHFGVFHYFEAGKRPDCCAVGELSEPKPRLCTAVSAARREDGSPGRCRETEGHKGRHRDASVGPNRLWPPMEWTDAECAADLPSSSAKKPSLRRLTLSRNTWGPATIPEGWPEGRNENLVEVISEGTSIPAVIEALWYPGCGYSVHTIPLEEKAPRRLSEEAKQSLRRKSLRRRLEAKTPLFADTLIKQEQKKQPDYFGEEPGSGKEFEQVGG